MTIKEHLAAKHPEVVSVLVTVKEVCFVQHPPRIVTWTYSEGERVDREVLGHICHGKTPLKTAHFDLLMPIYQTLRRKKTKHSGNLPTYWSDDGKAVSRSYECEVTLREP